MKKKIRVIYNGFLNQGENFKIKDKERFSDKFSIGYLGRFENPKGVHVLINSAKKLPGCEFFLAGQGILEDRLRELAKDFKNIHFLGSFKEPLEFISKMDVMIVPSIREPLGNVIIEAGFLQKTCNSIKC